MAETPTDIHSGQIESVVEELIDGDCVFTVPEMGSITDELKEHPKTAADNPEDCQSISPN